MSHIGILIILTKWSYCYGDYNNIVFYILTNNLKWEACLLLKVYKFISFIIKRNTTINKNYNFATSITYYAMTKATYNFLLSYISGEISCQTCRQ